MCTAPTTTSTTTNVVAPTTTYANDVDSKPANSQIEDCEYVEP